MNLLKRKIISFLLFPVLLTSIVFSGFMTTTSCSKEPQDSRHDISNYNIIGIDFKFYASRPESISQYEIEGMCHSPQLLHQLLDFFQTTFNNKQISFKDFSVNSMAYPNEDFSERRSVLMSVSASVDSLFLYGNNSFSAMAQATTNQFIDISMLQGRSELNDLAVLCHDHQNASHVERSHVENDVTNSSTIEKAIVLAALNVFSKHIVHGDFYYDYSISNLPDFGDYTNYVSFNIKVIPTPNNISMLIGELQINIRFKVLTSPLFDISKLTNPIPTYSYETFTPYALTNQDLASLDNYVRTNIIAPTFEDLNSSHVGYNVVEGTDYDIIYSDANNELLGADASNGVNVHFTVESSQMSEYIIGDWSFYLTVFSVFKLIDLDEINWSQHWDSIISITLNVHDITAVTENELIQLNSNTAIQNKITSVINESIGMHFSSSDVFYYLQLTNSLSPGDKSQLPSSTEAANFILTTRVLANQKFAGRGLIQGRVDVTYVSSVVDITGKIGNIAGQQLITAHNKTDVSNAELTTILNSSLSIQNMILSIVQSSTIGNNASITHDDYTISMYTCSHTDLSTPRTVTATITSNPSSLYIRGIATITLIVIAQNDESDKIVTVYQDVQVETVLINKNFTRHGLKQHLDEEFSRIRINFQYHTNNLKDLPKDSSGRITMNVEDLVKNNKLTIISTIVYDWNMNLTSAYFSDQNDHQDSVTFSGNSQIQKKFTYAIEHYTEEDYMSSMWSSMFIRPSSEDPLLYSIDLTNCVWYWNTSQGQHALSLKDETLVLLSAVIVNYV